MTYIKSVIFKLEFDNVSQNYPLDLLLRLHLLLLL